MRLDPLREISGPHVREEVPNQADIRKEIENLESSRRTDSAASRMKDSEGSTIDEPFARTGSAWRVNAKNKAGDDQKVQIW